MEWWLWILIGLALLALELLTPGGFYVLFFGVGALAVGALTSIHAAGPPSVQWLLFSLGSVAALLLFRRRLLSAFAPASSGIAVDSLERDVATLTQDLPVGGVGKAELRGTTWSVRNAGDRDLASGQRCRVERVEGITLWVRAE